MRLTPSLKLGLIAFLAVDLALAFVFGVLYFLRSDLKLEDDLRNVGATIYQEPFQIKTFELVDQNSRAYVSEDLEGQWSLIFFGFTSCPDICPITMAELKKFADLWSDAESSKQLDIILATVDPNNDDPSALKEYLANFNPNFIGLTGHQVDLAGLAESLFVGYGDPAATSNHFPSRGEHGTAKGLESYAIDHSSHISVISPEAQLVAVIRPPHRARDLLKALELIIASH